MQYYIEITKNKFGGLEKVYHFWGMSKETESVKIDAKIVGSVRKRTQKTRQTIGGFFELAAKAALSIDQEYVKWKEKAEKWDSLSERIGEYYTEDAPEFQLDAIGEIAASAFGYL